MTHTVEEPSWVALQEVMEVLRGLSASVTQIGVQVDRVSAHLTLPDTLPAPPACTPPPDRLRSQPREPFIPAPERYAGDLGRCRSFLLQCSLVFDQQPSMYTADRSRIAFMTGLLTGNALTWASAVWESQSPCCSSYPLFVAELRRVFDHPVRGKEASQCLFMLHQGSSSVAEYAVDFRFTAADSGWNDLSLRGAFLHGLSDRIKDELAARDETQSLDDLISLAMRLDNRLRERQREKSSRPSSGSSSRVPSLDTSGSSSAPPVFRRRASGTTSSTSPGDEPMQLGRTHLSPAERLRRVQSGACIYCGQSGHFLASCPLRPKERARQ